jgi:hypothetical protein
MEDKFDDVFLNTARLDIIKLLKWHFNMDGTEVTGEQKVPLLDEY